jgi:hypothetical protein
MFLNQCGNPIDQVRRASGLMIDGYNPTRTGMAIWLIVIAVTLAVWWVERECSIEATGHRERRNSVVFRSGVYSTTVFVKMVRRVSIVERWENGRSSVRSG